MVTPNSFTVRCDSAAVNDVLVIGGSGLLGQHLLREATTRGYRAQGTYSTEPVPRFLRLDVSDVAAARELVSRVRPGVVVVAAAMTNVDGCESRPDVAERVNAIAPGEIARASKEVGARVVHVSTDYVFDGRSAPSDESTPPKPINAYGRTKLEGERNVLAADSEALVVRTCANFGWNRLRSKEDSVTWILRGLRQGKALPLFTDQRVSPSYAPHVARVAFDLLEKEEAGIYHVATKGCLSRFEIGEAVCRAFGLPASLLIPSTLEDAHLVAPRPRLSCLTSRRLERFPNIPVPPFHETLDELRRTE